MDELKLYTYIAVFGSFGMYFAIAWWARGIDQRILYCRWWYRSHSKWYGDRR